jgi:hypothetical protein
MILTSVCAGRMSMAGAGSGGDGTAGAAALGGRGGGAWWQWGRWRLAAWGRRGAARRRGGRARRPATWWRREAARRRGRGLEERRKEVSEEKKRGRRPEYYSTALPSARSRALGKEFFKNFKIHFAECLGPGTRQSRLCRVPTDRHSAKP